MASVKSMMKFFCIACIGIVLTGCMQNKKHLTPQQKYEQVCKKYTQMSEEKQLEALDEDWQYIHYMKHPSLRVQLAAIEKNPKAVAEIERPALEVQMIAVDKLIDGEGFSMTLARLIDKFDEKAQIAAVSKSPQIIRYIPYPSKSVQMAAVEKNPWVARSINNLSKEAKAEAIRREPKLKSLLP